jgi:hypothetical protein
MGGDGHGNTGTVFSNCTLDGGIPPWCFRTDQKSRYRYRFDGDPDGHVNKVAEGTSGSLMTGDVLSNQQTEIHHCEFVRGHDLLIVGQSFSFHHNVVDEMQDDALAIGFGLTSGDLHENVILRCQTAMSFAGSVVGGPYRIFRNLFDLRSPIAAIRPRPDGDLEGSVSAFRFGQFYKGSNDGDDGPIDLFQNTCLVRSQEGATSFQFYRHSPPLGPPPPLGPRRSFNNIFVDVEPAPKKQDRATAYLPTFVPGSWPADGNCYFRVGAFFADEGSELTGVLRHDAFPGFNGFPGFPQPKEYSSLAEYHEGPPGTDEYFQQSKTLYEPGYENSSLDGDPKFRGFDPSGLPSAGDDLRLKPVSPAAGGGIILNTVNPPILDPGAPASGKPDMGCFEKDGRLKVGVDGLMTFP